MARTGRPKTTAADHERLTARFPVEVMAQIRAMADANERPLNTELLRIVRAGLQALALPAQPKRSRRVEPTPC